MKNIVYIGNVYLCKPEDGDVWKIKIKQLDKEMCIAYFTFDESTYIHYYMYELTNVRTKILIMRKIV